jgi:hypothetical protein
LTFKDFIERIGTDAHLTLPPHWQELDDVELAKQFLATANQFFFQTHANIGTTPFEGSELAYFSDFHRFWEKHHHEVINARINYSQARQAAEALRDVWHNHGKDVFSVNQNRHGLTVEQLAQVRFFTANQDFRKSPDDQFTIYLEQPDVFDPAAVAESPDDFLSSMGLNQLSQSDKRRNFARNAARFLLERGINAFQIAANFQNDAVAIRQAIIGFGNTGYGEKKTNMLIRDMFVWDVWPKLTNLEQIDVASDINTMKVALRTRILQSDIPLISSFLDVFCHQYAYIDRKSAQAWRAVWEEWRKLDSATAPSSPGLLDFIIYRLGREYCKPMAGHYECENTGHYFYHYGNRKADRACVVCDSARPRVRNKARLTNYIMPCQIPLGEQPRNPDKTLRLDANNLLHTLNGICLFVPVCRPDTDEFRMLMPPRSISVKGQTGWTDAYSNIGQGGGGLSG